MGLFKAATSALGSQLADQWREFFYCESLDIYTLGAKGQKRISEQGRSSNTKASDNIISNGSIVAINEGQCMLIVEQGKVVDVCAEPGEFIYDTSTEPSVFYGSLGSGIKRSFATVGKRFTLGGDTGKDQRVYYFNTKELVSNKFGTVSPIPFRVVDDNIGLDIDISVRCNGEYSFRIIDPITFYTNVTGNFADRFGRGVIDGQLKVELLTALQPAFAKLSRMGIRYSSIPEHAKELAEALNKELSSQWRDLRGLEITSLGISAISASDEDQQLIKEVQKTAIMRNPTMAAATMIGAQADAMRAAAQNEGGAMMGFMGLGMAQQAGGANVQNLYSMGQAQTQVSTIEAFGAESQLSGWTCSCGAEGNQSKFCGDCGKPRPESTSWLCSCGALNTKKFCAECGNEKPPS
ncbi:MAG: SPFH domain-containing protein [Coriobacteriales bacterium]|jgi:membrane protease subunit (stomatin/prohibitin family)|nr:SPFH domain-containing protein [Coriobacteriales bacterium]